MRVRVEIDLALDFIRRPLHITTNGQGTFCALKNSSKVHHSRRGPWLGILYTKNVPFEVFSINLGQKK
jgi:hypothetical protein